MKNWNRIENAADLGEWGGVFYQCEEYARILHIVLLRAPFSQNLKYWYEIRDVLVPIFHMLSGIGTNFSRCEFEKFEICGSTQLSRSA